VEGVGLPADGGGWREVVAAQVAGAVGGDSAREALRDRGIERRASSFETVSGKEHPEHEQPGDGTGQLVYVQAGGRNASQGT
jgi:hypothetical protein